MAIQVPAPALEFGFANDPVGTHTSRTIMLAELRQLLAACPATAGLEAYRAAIVDENVLLKRTVTTRKQSLRALRELYALDPAVPVFRALRDLWDEDAEGQPLLALLCAAARDPLLRATAELVLATPPGMEVTPRALAEAAGAAFPSRYGTSLVVAGRNIASSWQQSGHLRGRLTKVRARAESRPAAAAYALLLAYLCSARGEGLFETPWSRLLDAPVHLAREQAIAAARRGLLEYRHSGTVTDLSFRHLLRAAGQEGEA